MANIFEDIKSGLVPKLVVLLAQRENEKAEELFKIDATLVKTHSMASQATNFEVEDGSDLSDHVINRGVRLSIQGVISDDPITIKEAAVALIPGIVGGNFIGGLAGAAVAGVGSKIASSLLEEDEKPSLTVYTKFREIYDKKISLKIDTGLVVYTNMIMERLIIPQRSTTANGLHFTASFREIRIATSEIISIDVDSTNAKGVVPENNKGSSPVEETTPAEEGQGASWAVQLYEWIF